MDVSVLDFTLFNIVSYIFGIATGLIICCSNKDLRRSPSFPSGFFSYPPAEVPEVPVVASAPPSLKVTVE
mgnify:CR=1 FL=1